MLSEKSSPTLKYFMAIVRVDIDWINSSKQHQQSFVPKIKDTMDDIDDMWGVYEALPDGTKELLGIFPLGWRATQFMKALE